MQPLAAESWNTFEANLREDITKHTLTKIWGSVASRDDGLVRQPHLVMFEALSVVVVSFGACLVDSSPVRPVVGVVAWVVWMGQCGP